MTVQLSVHPSVWEGTVSICMWLLWWTDCYLYMCDCAKRSVVQCVLNNSKWKENINKQLKKNTFTPTLTPYPHPSKTRKKRKEKGMCNYMHHNRTPSLICSIGIRILLISCVVSTYTHVNSMCPGNIINITH